MLLDDALRRDTVGVEKQDHIRLGLLNAKIPGAAGSKSVELLTDVPNGQSVGVLLDNTFEISSGTVIDDDNLVDTDTTEADETSKRTRQNVWALERRNHHRHRAVT